MVSDFGSEIERSGARVKFTVIEENYFEIERRTRFW